MDSKIKFSLNQRVKKYEICHYADENQIITSIQNRVSISTGESTVIIRLPFTKLDFFGFIRLARRALRLDKCNVVPVGDEDENLIIIRSGKVYHYDAKSKKLILTLKLLNCRNVLHQSICIQDKKVVFLGEYGGNPSRLEVPLYRSLDGGLNWEKIFVFPAGKIKHIHGCYWDPFEKKVWVLTGDFSDENYMVVSDLDFKNVKWLGDGTQMWRACNLFFERDNVFWIMDSQLEDSHLIIYNRSSKIATKHSSFPGPVWYSKRLEDGYYLAATTCEIGPGVKDDYAHLMVSKNMIDWFDVHQFQHDHWPKRYFKFGVIGFADGKQTSSSFYIFGEALKGIDGSVFQCSLKLEGNLG
jgi:hypothetical protein